MGFRVYHDAEHKEFVDYNIHLEDCFIRIVGGFYGLYSGGDKHWLDYSPRVLDYEVVESET